MIDDPTEPSHRPDPADPLTWDDDELGDPYDVPHDGYENDDHHEYATIRTPSARGGCARWLAVLGGVVLLGLGAAAYGWFWYQGEIDPGGEPGPPVAVVVPAGATSGDIGQLLADSDVITSSRVWGWYLRLNGGGPFQAGEYTLPTNAAMADVVTLLEAGPAPPESDGFTIPEAFTVTEITERLADPDLGIERFSVESLDQLLASGAITSRTKPADQASMEGLLFPDTFQVDDDETE